MHLNVNITNTYVCTYHIASHMPGCECTRTYMQWVYLHVHMRKQDQEKIEENIKNKVRNAMNLLLLFNRRIGASKQQQYKSINVLDKK